MKIIRHLDSFGSVRYAARHVDGRHTVLDGELFDEPLVDTGRPADVFRLLAPVQPTGIVCVGLNYRQHAIETKAKIPEYPVVFMKLATSIQDPLAPIELPKFLESTEVDYECELAVVIGRACKNVSKERALDYVLGYTCANDVSARDWQVTKGGSQWCRGKTFDTFTPLGPCLVTADEMPNPNAAGIGIRTTLNGDRVQDWRTDDMIFDVASLITFLSGSTTLPAGTVILTGTPHGVGMARTPKLWMKPGDTVSVEIDGIGTLTNPIINEPC